MRAPERLGPYVYRQSDGCFSLGADRLRDVVASPKVQNASELMTECPAAVPEKALRELGITTEGNSLT